MFCVSLYRQCSLQENMKVRIMPICLLGCCIFVLCLVFYFSFVVNSCNYFVNSKLKGLPSYKENSTQPEQKNCTWLEPPVRISEDTWVPLYGKENLIYSAYFVEDKQEVVIMAVRDRKMLNTSKVFCHVWGINRTIHITETLFTSLPAHNWHRYECAIYTCPVGESIRPQTIVLSTEQCDPSGPTLQVKWQGKMTDNFTVCSAPLHSTYKDGHALVQMIELNRILGATKFLFYINSININVNIILQFYKNLGLVEMIPWHVPLRTKNPRESVVHYFAQEAALNDCLYRKRHVSKYIVIQDLDEFIIPKRVKTWYELLEELPDNYSSYSFRNVFFPTNWPDDSKSFPDKNIAQKYRVTTLLKQSRESKIFPNGERSKYIYDPLKVEAVTIHFPIKYREGKEYTVDPNDALLQHYRSWASSYKKEKVEDRTSMNYSSLLLSNIQKTWRQLKDAYNLEH